VISSRIGIITVFKNLGKVHNVLILLLMGLCAFAVGHGFFSWLPKILEENGCATSS
jgi:hypothetical protein